MKYKAGDQPKVRRYKDMLCEFHVQKIGGEIVICPGANLPGFVGQMATFCNDIIEIGYITKDERYKAHGWYWVDDFFERGEVNEFTSG